MCLQNLTHMLEKIVPIAKYIILGSFSRMLLGECIIQIVEIAKSKIKGTNGLMASGNVRILPLLSLYDLQKKIVYVEIAQVMYIVSVIYIACNRERQD